MVLVGAVLADTALGDPPWLPHPVRAMGAACTFGERVARAWAAGNARRELVAGAILTTTIVALAYALPHRLIALARARDERAGVVCAIALGWTTLAARDLLHESGTVLGALDAGDLARARARLARIVGRETARLDANEIARATIETLAESACDGIVAPLCALALGGVPLACAFKATSTLDSMIGHIEAPYTYLGRFAARVDDVACYVPARLTALALCATAPLLASPCGSARAAWRLLRRDGHAHASPNAGQSEAALAGALGIRLGGTNVYDGVARETPLIGAEYRVPDAADVRRARHAVTYATLACAIACVTALASGDAARERRRHKR